jgi:hypothetical protein
MLQHNLAERKGVHETGIPLLLAFTSAFLSDEAQLFSHANRARK